VISLFTTDIDAGIPLYLTVWTTFGLGNTLISAICLSPVVEAFNAVDLVLIYQAPPTPNAIPIKIAMRTSLFIGIIISF